MKLFRTLATVVLGTLVVVTLGVLLVPQAFGWQGYVVTSQSMEPTITRGSVVLVAPTDPATLAPGDVVTFRGESGGLTTHRIDSVTDQGSPGYGFVTRGDANEDVDPVELSPTEVVGQVRLDVPVLGWAVSWISTPVGLAVFAFAMLALVMAPSPHDPGSRADDEVEADPVTAART
jgi:signal peptidase